MHHTSYIIPAIFCAGLQLASASPAMAADSANIDSVVETIPAVANNCAGGTCKYRVTAKQLLAKAEELVRKGEYQAAGPFVDALQHAPQYRFQRRYLAGYIAVETGQLDLAAKYFRGILKDDPSQTRVRLELARTQLLRGKEGSADYHFRLAQQDENLPDEIAQTIRNTRSVLRDQRTWRFGFDVGFAPDTNINGATDAETVDINFGPIKLPLTLNANAKQRSGVGQTAGFSGGLRIRTSDNVALLFDSDARMVNYDGTDADDVVVQLAAGPEFKVGKYTRLSVQAVGQQRWYGGKLATRQYGAKIGLQKALDEGQRIGVEFDGRRSDSGFSTAYSGWQMGANVTYERIVARSMVASISLFGRRDELNSAAFSNTLFGTNLGVGGELPFGLNAGLSGGITRANYDAPQLIYSNEKRQEWRYNARAYLGSRQVRILGFSPSVAYNYVRSDSNYVLYKTNRHKVNFKLARYF